MHILSLTQSRFSEHLDLLAATYRLRRRVFRDRLDWTVSVSDELEIDTYDTIGPTYLLLLRGDRDVVGSVRLLPTTGPTMLANTFASLLGGETPPRSTAVLESSRFCVDSDRSGDLARNGLRRATLMLFAGMIEWAKAAAADAIVTVTDLRMERVLRRAGWPLQRIGTPKRIGDTIALAGFLPASDGALAAIYRNGGLSGPVLQTLDPPFSLTGLSDVGGSGGHACQT